MKKSNSFKKISYKKTIPAIIVLILTIVAGFFGLNKLEEKQHQQAMIGIPVEEPEDYILIDDVKCRQKPNLETYLFMGTDIRGALLDYAEHGYDGTGQCDMIQLLVIDKTNDTYATLSIDRNTYTKITAYDEDGNYNGEFKAPICLAYAYGYDGTEHACANMTEAVSNLLYGQRIDGYMALGLDSISTINHMLGGVTVTVKDDFSSSCPSLVKGTTVKLTDEEAVHYCHDRMSMEDDSNVNRMARQSAYLSAAKPILEQKVKESETYILNFYDALGEHMYSNITKNQISRISKAMLKNTDLGQFELKGETVYDKSDEWMRFNPDKDSLRDLVIDLFYDRVEEKETDVSK